MTNPRLQEIVLDTPLHQIIRHAPLRHLLIALHTLVVIPLHRAQIPDLQPQLIRQRFRVVALEPARCDLVRVHRPFGIPQFDLVYLSEVLLVGGRAPEIALGGVMGDRGGEDAGGVFRVGLAVGFVGFGEGVCGVVGFGEFGGLDAGGAFEGLAGFFACGEWLAGGRGVGGKERLYLAFAFERHSRLGCRGLLRFRISRSSRRRRRSLRRRFGLLCLPRENIVRRGSLVL